jgi:NADPH:quinone reductase-like Zn-dependent oxidoreductase
LKFSVFADRVHCKPNLEQLAAISTLIDEGKLTAHVATVLPMKDVNAAFQLSESGRTRGKIVLQIGT